MEQHDLLAATAALEASTTALRRQEEVLREQRKYVESIRSRRVEDDGAARARRRETQNLTLVVGQTLAVRFPSYEILTGGRKLANTRFPASGA